MEVADLAQFAQQPFAIFGFHRHVALATGIPALEQRFGSHHANLVLNLRHDVEAAIEDQLNAGKALVQTLDQRDQAGLLGTFIEFPGQTVGIEGVEKEAAIPFLPERCEDTVEQEFRPHRLRQIENQRPPVPVIGQTRGAGNILEPGSRGMRLTDAHISVEFAVRLAITHGVVTVVRINDDDVERLELIQRRIRSIEQGDRRRIGEGG